MAMKEFNTKGGFQCLYMSPDSGLAGMETARTSRQRPRFRNCQKNLNERPIC
jgi:hypothetical protein